MGSLLLVCAGTWSAAAAAPAPRTAGAVVEIPRGTDGLPRLNAPPRSLLDRGPTLVYSDDPETAIAYGVLYRDRLRPGRARVYLYHVNGTSADARCDLLVSAPGSSRVRVVRSVGATGPKDAAIGLCRRAAAQWLGMTSADGAGPSVTASFQPRPLTAESLGTTIAPNELCHAWLEIEATGPVELVVTFGPAEEDGWQRALEEGLAEGDGFGRQGTFASSERYAGSPYDWDAAAGGATLLVGKGEVDPPLAGRDAESGEETALKGNYGVVYDIPVRARGLEGRSAEVIIVPRGGGYGGAFAVRTASGRSVSSAPVDRHALAAEGKGVVLAVVPSEDAEAGFVVQTTPNGGCALPFELLLLPAAAD